MCAVLYWFIQEIRYGNLFYLVAPGAFLCPKYVPPVGGISNDVSGKLSSVCGCSCAAGKGTEGTVLFCVNMLGEVGMHLWFGWGKEMEVCDKVYEGNRYVCSVCEGIEMWRHLWTLSLISVWVRENPVVFSVSITICLSAGYGSDWDLALFLIHLVKCVCVYIYSVCMCICI